MREIVQLAVIIAIVITKGRFIAGARSGAPQRSKMGKKLGYDVSVRPPVRTDWQGGTKWNMQGNPRHVACVCIGETLGSSPIGNQMRGKCSINTQ